MENKFYILALGCKVNTYEIEAIKEELINLGYEQTFLIDDANYIIINTCCVTNTAQAKSRQKLHSLHKQNPNAKIIAMGCYVQGFTNEVSQMNFVNLLVGTNKRSKIKDYFPNLNLNNSINLVEEVKNNVEYENLHVSSYSENTRAFLKIQDGCNNFCSYCIIPYVRGTIKSRPLNEILLETENFLKKGYKEIVLTGIHTGSYGKDLSNFTFSDLVEKLINFEKLYRLRISSIEESEIDEKLISILKSNKKTTTDYRTAFAQAIGTTGTISKIVKMAFGTDGEDDGQGNPAPPTDNGPLNNVVLTKNIKEVTYPVETSVCFEAEIEAGEYTGAINEVALIDEQEQTAAKMRLLTSKGVDAESGAIFKWTVEF